MLDEGNDLNLETTDTPPEEKGNKTFLIVGGIMAGLVFLTLICMAIYLFAIRPTQTKNADATKTAVALFNQQEIGSHTETAEAALWSPTPEPTFTFTPSKTTAPATPTVSNTPVLVEDTTLAAETPQTDPATLEAMQTELSLQMTSTGAASTDAASAGAASAGTRAIGGEGTPSGMPATGFFDEVGLPMLAILTLALLVVIFLARRLRHSPAK